MDKYRSHIIHRLRPFTKKRSEQFGLVFMRMQHPHKQRYQGLLAYVDNLLNGWEAEPVGDLTSMHIHFPFFEADEVVLLEFLCIRLFLSTQKRPAGTAETVTYLRNHIDRVNRALARPIELGASNRKKDWQKKTEERKHLVRLKEALTALELLDLDTDREDYRPRTLVNVLKKDKDALIGQCSPSPYFMTADEYEGSDLLRPLSYVLLNDQWNMDELDTMEIGELQDILEHIEQVVLFNSDGKNMNRQFGCSQIKKLNADEGLNVKRLLIISFDQKPLRLHKLITYLNTISIRYRERTTEHEVKAYAIMPWEVDDLLGIDRPQLRSLHLVGRESLFWTELQEALNEYEELRELTSIKLRNIYSLCMSNEYKRLLLTDLFSAKGHSKLLLPDTRDTLIRLGLQEQEEIKGLLSSVLDAVQQQGLYERMRALLDQNGNCFILPYALQNHPMLEKLVMSSIRSFLPRATFKDWKEVRPAYDGNIIMLDYRDPGRYPFRYYPNIFEYTHACAQSIQGLFLRMFFQYNYEHALYSYTNTLYGRELDHPVRRASFNWETLQGFIRNTRPDDSYDHLWDLDNNFSNQTDREMVAISFATGSKKAFYPTELFVARYADDDQLVILTAEEIHVDRKPYTKLSIQPLEELYEGGNLFEATIQEESEIKVLKEQWGLPEHLPDSGIWKLLLTRKVAQSSATAVYTELRRTLAGLPFVREGYFIDNWLDINSDLLIPRSKKVFRLLCTYLDLPVVYFRVMLKRRARERLASRKSAVQMDRLIARLVEMGLFQEEPPVYQFDAAFLQKYDLEEIGFSLDKLTGDLYVLADMCRARLALKEVLTTESKQST